MLSFIPGEVWVLLGGLVAALGAFLWGERQGTSKGRSQARTDALEADTKRAGEVERKADEAREHFVDRNPVERLRDANRLRDD